MDGADQKRKKRKKSKNRETKVILKFDDSKRAEFLTGFRKRKNERKEKAKKENERACPACILWSDFTSRKKNPSDDAHHCLSDGLVVIV